MHPETRTITVNTESGLAVLTVSRIGVGPIITEAGRFCEYQFKSSDRWQEYQVLVKCRKLNDQLMPVFGFPRKPLAIRIDSGCLTSEFGDMTCECRQQKELGLRQIADWGQGLLIRIPSQDGRGQGLPFKLATLTLQEELGMDTVEAAQSLLRKGQKLDARTYSGCVGILRFFGIGKGAHLILLTNNPDKIKALEKNEYVVTRTPCVIEPTKYTLRHLAAKQQYLHHIGLLAPPVTYSQFRKASISRKEDK
jgi:GTP cyclohydrolase II